MWSKPTATSGTLAIVELTSGTGIEMWRQKVSSIYESIEKEITKLKTMMPKPTDSYSVLTKNIMDQAVVVEKMIHSYAEMCNGIEPEVAETLNVPDSRSAASASKEQTL